MFDPLVTTVSSFITQIVPIALTVAAPVFAVTMGWKVFKKITGR